MLYRCLAIVLLLAACVADCAAEQKTLGDRVAAFCEGQKGKKVGDGECTTLADHALRAAGAHGRGKDDPLTGEYTWGWLVFHAWKEKADLKTEGRNQDIRRGDIIQFHDVKLEDHGRWWIFPHHTAVVVAVEDKGQTVKFLHQNVTSDKAVVDGILHLDDLKQGFYNIYRPVPGNIDDRTFIANELARALQAQFAQQRQELDNKLRGAIDASEEELRSALQSRVPLDRFAAAYAVGERRLFWQHDLILLLTDESDAVRQGARRSLVTLSSLKLNPDAAAKADKTKPSGKLAHRDFGPLPNASRSSQKKSVEKWTEWWKAQEQTALKQTAKPGKDSEPEQLSKRLVEATGQKRKELLKTYAETSGTAYTESIALAIPHLSGESRKEAREALAERLSGRKETTLLRYLEDSDAEIRRGAALALGMRDAKETVGELAKLLLDPAPSVARAAHAALRSLTGQDYGPSVTATEEEKQKAAERYQA